MTPDTRDNPMISLILAITFAVIVAAGASCWAWLAQADVHYGPNAR